jgi:phenylalanine ammonia-lyase
MAVLPVDLITTLGVGTARLYAWVRGKLGVPTQCGIDDDPLYNAQKGQSTEGKKTIGSWVSMVYESLKDDMIDVVVMEGIANDWLGPESEDEYEELCQDFKAIN